MPTTVIATIGTYVITTGTVLAFIAKVALSYAISALLSPKQKSNAGDFNSEYRGLTLSQLNSAANWEIVYGTVRKGGTVVFRHVTTLLGNQSHDENHVVPATAPYTVTVANASTFVNATLVRKVIIDNGGEGTTYEYIELFPTTAADPLEGYYHAEGGVFTFHETMAGCNVRLVYDANDGPVVGKHLHQVIVLASHQCEAIDEVYFNDELVEFDANGYATGKYAGGYAFITKHLGVPGDPADASLMSFAPDKWTPAHRGEGHCYIYVRLFRGTEVGPWTTGAPNISVLMRGKRVYDPRTATTYFTDTASLCLADYINSELGLNVSYSTGITDGELIASANVDEENVTIASGGTEHRYTVNGVVNTAVSPREIIGRLLSANAGRAVRVGGQWKIYSGAYVAPTLTFTESDLAGPIKTSTLLSARDAFNGVKGLYMSPQNAWQLSDFPPIGSATYAAQDGQTVWKDIELPFTTSAATAQRLAKIELLRARQEISHQLVLKLQGYKVEPPDNIALTLDKYGYSGKAFEIAEMGIDFSDPAIRVEMSVRETASNIYDWSVDEESPVDAAPNTTLPNPFVVLPPGVPDVEEFKYQQFNMSVKVKARVSWAAPQDAQARSYDLQYKKRSDAQWITQSGITSRTADVLDVEADAYLFRVAAVNAIGVRSLWVQAEKTFVGLTDAPADVSGFTVIKSGGFALAQWDVTTDLDVQINGTLVIRHSPLTTGAAWENGVIIDSIPGGNTQALVPLMTGTYMAKFIDSSGNYSEAMASFVVTEGMVTGWTTIATSTQAPTFSGTKTSTAVVSSALQLDSEETVGSMTTLISTWPMLSALGRISATGSYDFTTYVDAGTVATRRFEADIAALSFDTGDIIGLRTNLISTWPSIAGDAVNDCDVTLYARITDDDPAGTPAWGAWTPFFVADFTCRAAQFKLDFESGAPNHNIAVSTLTVHVKEPA